MTQTSYPFDGVSTTEAQFSQLFREFTDTGVAASADALSLKVSADAGGMRVFVQPGFAIVRGFAYNSTAVEQLTIAAANTTVRVDRVVLRLDPSVNSIVLAVKTGTPSSYTPAALTQTDSGIYELSLGLVEVGPSVSSIAAVAVTDDRTLTSLNTSVWTATTRPSLARQGKLGYNLTTLAWEFWTGSVWTPLMAPAVAALADHAADATDVHGIADTAELATKTYADAKVANTKVGTSTTAAMSQDAVKKYVQSGTAVVSAATGNITFPTAFGSAPMVVACLGDPSGSHVTVVVGAISSTLFNVTGIGWTSGSWRVNWIAVGA